MKTTIKLKASSQIVVNPLKTGGVFVEVTTSGTESGKHPLCTFSLTPDQAGALIVGLEVAIDPEFMQVAA